MTDPGPIIDRNQYVVHYVGFLRANIEMVEERQIRKRLNQEQHLRWLALLSGGAIGLLLSNFAPVSALVGAAPLKATMAFLVAATASACVALGASIGQLNLAETLLRECLSYYSSVVSKQEFLVKAGVLVPYPVAQIETLHNEIDQGLERAYESTGLRPWATRFRQIYQVALGGALVTFGAAFLPALAGLLSQ